MLAIALRFPAGRYHATPWGRHVNEADVEWPPSPWRLLRALIATWHRKLDPDQYPEATLRSLVNAMSAALPAYRLPSGARAHTRHYVPVREGSRDKSALIFDGFIRLDPGASVLIAWPDLELSSDESELLDALLSRLGYLGRAESWVEAWRSELQADQLNCFPETHAHCLAEGELTEPARTLAPMSFTDYQDWRAEYLPELSAGRRGKALQRLQKTLPEGLTDALRLDTADLQAAGWSKPPAARYVTYQRPYQPFMPVAATRARGRPVTNVNSVSLALVGKPLPRFEDAVRVGELMRVAAMSRNKHADGGRPVPPELSGHGMPAGNRHDHAFYLPQDADQDGRIDHLMVHVPGGLSEAGLQLLSEVERLWTRDGNEWQVLLESYGQPSAMPHLCIGATASSWVSLTPYLHPWHRKKTLDVSDQIRRECYQRGLPEPIEISTLPDIQVGSQRRRPAHFHRFRNKRGLTQPDTRGQFCRLIFDRPIAGPLALGFGCHFGLGMFRPDDR